MAGRTVVDQQELSAVADPHLQILQTTNTRQRRNGFPPFSARSPGLERLLCVNSDRQDRIAHIGPQ